MATNAPWKQGNYQGMPYYVLEPAGFDPNVAYPTVLFLHQFENEDSEPGQTEAWFYNSAFRANLAFKALVIVPICSINGQTSTTTFNWGGVTQDLQQPIVHALGVLDQVQTQYKADRSRSYITGNSMGGLGTHGVLTRDEQRALFAAAMPVSGSAYYKVGHEAEMAAKLKDYPIWSCHGSQDHSVSPAYDIALYREMQAIGGRMKFTNDPNGAHDTWDKFYADQATWTWLFQQSATGGTVSAPAPHPATSPDNTVISKASDPAVVDAHGDSYTITDQGQIAVNGAVDSTTRNVILLWFSGGIIYQQNAAQLCWSKGHAGDTWQPANVSPPHSATPPVPPLTQPPVTQPPVTQPPVNGGVTITPDPAQIKAAQDRIDAMISQLQRSIGDLTILKSMIGGL